MRVDTRLAAAPLSGAGSRSLPAGGVFSLGMEAARAPVSAGGAMPLANLSAILTLQGQDEVSADRRRRATRRGHDLLDALDRLKAALLGGRVAASELKAIAGRLAERDGSTGDPRLDDLLGHIELRAQVELAKLGVAGA
ncbi:flagellar assembly protein FliX [Methylobacterium platani]|uniref:Flagellar assembly protein fliX n=2 Tax=Methylobacterium platani TaxID=427683 RepID=A0A179RYW9_9HYPH|nr:flagellar assembly protein FliX [Methylobacterium platani]KMO16875.1 flagellar assembly protein fliX [Methylobacterium platani JCM 14648]OAS13504.1 flagellar assembly protein fliX [Methylobacterium platani]